MTTMIAFKWDTKGLQGPKQVLPVTRLDWKHVNLVKTKFIPWTESQTDLVGTNQCSLQAHQRMIKTVEKLSHAEKHVFPLPLSLLCLEPKGWQSCEVVAVVAADAKERTRITDLVKKEIDGSEFELGFGERNYILNLFHQTVWRTLTHDAPFPKDVFGTYVEIAVWQNWMKRRDIVTLNDLQLQRLVRLCKAIPSGHVQSKVFARMAWYAMHDICALDSSKRLQTELARLYPVRQ